MKDQPPFPFDSPEEERFIDAAIREKVRLGSASEDSDLIKSILVATVEKSEAPSQNHTMRREDQKLWFVGVASAAAILAVLATLLAVLPFRPSDREAEEVRFIVRYLDPVEIATEPDFTSAPKQLLPAPFSGSIEIDSPTDPIEPGSPSVKITPIVGDSFPPSFAEVPETREREERLKIVADETRDEAGRRVYLGNVEVRHKSFRLFSDRVELSGVDAEETLESVFLTASNVVFEQAATRRKVEASSLEYEPNSRIFTLMGVSSFESPEGFLGAFDPEDRIILSSNSFSIQTAPPTIKYANPAPLERIRE